MGQVEVMVSEGRAQGETKQADAETWGEGGGRWWQRTHFLG